MIDDRVRDIEVEDPNAYVKTAVFTDVTSLRNLVRSLCENYPVNDDIRFIDYLLGLVVLAAREGEIVEKLQ